MTFVYPVILLALWLAPLLAAVWVWLRRRKRASLDKIALPALQRSRSPGAERVFMAQVVLATCGLSLVVIAMARPCWGERDEVVYSRGRNVLLAVDVSRSMLAEDVRPNRLERARADLRDLLEDLRGDRAGLLAFRGSSVLLCPLTSDVAFLRHTLEHLSIDSAPRGETDLGEAIISSLRALEDFGGDHNAVILVSDGEDLAGKALAAARVAGERGIPIFTVGIGDERGATIPAGSDGVMRYGDEIVKTALDNQSMLDIAAASGGKYIPLRTAATGNVTLGTLYWRHLRDIAAQELEERAERRRIERYFYFLFPGILCLFALAWLSDGRPSVRRRKSSLRLSATLGALCVLAGVVLGDGGAAPEADARISARDLARRGQAAYAKGDFEKAARDFLDAADSPDLRSSTAAIFRYNGALAQLKSGAYTNAAESFRSAIRDLDSGVPALEGLGAALYEAAAGSAGGSAEVTDGAGASGVGAGAGAHEPGRLSAGERLELLRESAEAFGDALRGSPGRDELRRNFAAAAGGIPQLREEALAEELFERYGESEPADILAELLRKQRAAYAAAAAAATNRGPGQIAEFEKAAKLQGEAADMWLPLAPKLDMFLAGAVTNAAELAEMRDRLAAMRPAQNRIADRLRDMDSAGVDDAGRQEEEALRYFVALAPPPLLLEEAIYGQTNALLQGATTEFPRSPLEAQRFAQAFTSLFDERFDEWADAVTESEAGRAGGGAEGEEAGPAISPEAREEIKRLAEETLRLQEEALRAAGEQGGGERGGMPESTRPSREKSLDNLMRIRELLPKSRQPQEQRQQSDEQEKDPDKNRETQPQQSEDEEGRDENRDDSEAESGGGEEEEETADEGETEEALPEDMKELMERILRQEKSRAEERRNRQRELPPLLHERDW